ncbi:unnamed protein product [Ectocarpus sp. 12 AP-2014]
MLVPRGFCCCCCCCCSRFSQPRQGDTSYHGEGSVRQEALANTGVSLGGVIEANRVVGFAGQIYTISRRNKTRKNKCIMGYRMPKILEKNGTKEHDSCCPTRSRVCGTCPIYLECLDGEAIFRGNTKQCERGRVSRGGDTFTLVLRCLYICLFLLHRSGLSRPNDSISEGEGHKQNMDYTQGLMAFGEAYAAQHAFACEKEGPKI